MQFQTCFLKQHSHSFSRQSDRALPSAEGGQCDIAKQALALERKGLEAERRAVQDLRKMVMDDRKVVRYACLLPASILCKLGAMRDTMTYTDWLHVPEFWTQNV
jgi:hypothetical protein